MKSVSLEEIMMKENAECKGPDRMVILPPSLQPLKVDFWVSKVGRLSLVNLRPPKETDEHLSLDQSTKPI